MTHQIRNRLNPDRKKEPPAKQSQAEATPSSAPPASEKAPKTPARKYRRPKKKKAPAMDGWDLSQFEVVEEPGKTRFHDFDLPLCLMRAICEAGFRYTTPVQAQTLAHTLAGKDAIGQAQTGTGKTAAFLITAITTLLAQKDKGRPGRPRALVIAPTRELVMQIEKDGRLLGKYCGIRLAAAFGGMDYEKQQRAIEDAPIDILVATPGRLLDFKQRRVVDLGDVEIMIIDEADRMLDMGFIPDVRRIVGSTRPKDKRQTLMFSATMTVDVKRLAAQWCKNPVQVEIEPEQVAVDTVEQIVYLTTAEEKYAVLYNVLTKQDLERVLVFTNRKDETRRLTERLKSNNINCAMLSGDVAQKKRMTTLERFRDGKIRVLVATDVAGRGIHIEGVSHVFNYTLPYEPEDYVHRIGRTGRAGHHGIAISFADEQCAFYLPEIEAYIGRKLNCVYPDEELVTPPPKGKPIPKSKGPRGNSRGGGGRGGRHRRSNSTRSRRRAGSR